MHSLFKIHLLIAVLTILAISCDKDDRDACCPKGPDSFEVGNGRVYVPNIFTPNFDGINDVFFLYGDSNIVEFKDFRITSGKTGALLFAADSFQPNNPGVGWAPEYLFNGKFKYFFTAITTDGTERKISGWACCYLYDSGNNWNLDCSDCRFATQHDGFGGRCAACPTYESACK